MRTSTHTKKPLRHEHKKKITDTQLQQRRARADSFEVIEIAYVPHIFYWIIRLKRGTNEPIHFCIGEDFKNKKKAHKKW